MRTVKEWKTPIDSLDAIQNFLESRDYDLEGTNFDGKTLEIMTLEKINCNDYCDLMSAMSFYAYNNLHIIFYHDDEEYEPTDYMPVETVLSET